MAKQISRLCYKNLKTLQLGRGFSSSSASPLSLGYVAGLQSSPTSSTSEPHWCTFNEAYEILEQVDPSELWEFEKEIWEDYQMKFIHSTKSISVIDRFLQEGNDDNRAIRSLVFNARPKLVQSSIEVEYNSRGSCNRILWQKPPPLVGLTSTHLGGLALAMPLWLANTQRVHDAQTSKRKSPNVLVIGAGGCTVPSLLAHSGCKVTAIEAHEDVRQAALNYFGASEAGIKLLLGYGEKYLRSNKIKVDILIIDAEDGKSAPPESMKSDEFWKDVRMNLNFDAVVAINVIADHFESKAFQKRLSDALPCHHVWRCEVPEIAEVSRRHCLLFAAPMSLEKDTMLTRVKGITEGFDFVDRPNDWMTQVELSIK